MKTIFVIYVLGFVSIIVLFVHDHRAVEAEGLFDPAAVAAQMRQLQPAPEEFETEATPGTPTPNTVPQQKLELPEETPPQEALPEEEAIPNTFEGLDAKISELLQRAKTDIGNNIEISQCYYRKAEMYRARIMELKFREKEAGPEEKYKLANRQDLLEGMRIDSLWRAIGVLNKLPEDIYEDTDVRMLKALIYLDLPNQVPLAISQLRDLAADPKAREKNRNNAKILIEKYGKKLEK